MTYFAIIKKTHLKAWQDIGFNIRGHDFGNHFLTKISKGFFGNCIMKNEIIFHTQNPNKQINK